MTMGASDIGPFDNDDAADWLSELVDTSDTSLIAAALDVVAANGEEFLDASDCSNALAAAEMLAALRGHPRSKLPASAKKWLKVHGDLDISGLVPEALNAVEQIRDNSELRDMREESEEIEEWLELVEDLIGRLSAK